MMIRDDVKVHIRELNMLRVGDHKTPLMLRKFTFAESLESQRYRSFALSLNHVHVRLSQLVCMVIAQNVHHDSKPETS